MKDHMTDAKKAVALFEEYLGSGLSRVEISTCTEAALFPLLDAWPKEIQDGLRATARAWMEGNRHRHVLATSALCDHDGHGFVCKLYLHHVERKDTDHRQPAGASAGQGGDAAGASVEPAPAANNKRAR
jgi:hypothetical protein